MRVCPVCESKKRDIKWRQSFLVPDGWTQPEYLDWCLCRACGMIFADNKDITQADYDRYYIEKYGYGVEDEEARARQEGHAMWLNQATQNKAALVVDFGAAGVLSTALKRFGFTNVIDVGAGESLPEKVDVLFAEHVLEHIYDLPTAMRSISEAMVPGSMLVVDGPEAAGMADLHAMPMLDFQQKHVNHFTFYHYLHLMRRHGFEFMGAQNYIERKGACIHMLFGKAPMERVLDLSLQHIHASVNELVKKLFDIGKREVVVWGCGDVALHCLSLYRLKVKYFVDKDPAFRGATLIGRKVLENVRPGETAPIVVLAQGQKMDILQNIQREGWKNEIIVI
jgi:hypothetical protein